MMGLHLTLLLVFFTTFKGALSGGGVGGFGFVFGGSAWSHSSWSASWSSSWSASWSSSWSSSSSLSSVSDSQSEESESSESEFSSLSADDISNDGLVTMVIIITAVVGSVIFVAIVMSVLVFWLINKSSTVVSKQAILPTSRGSHQNAASISGHITQEANVGVNGSSLPGVVFPVDSGWSSHY
ncbi:uncharacterized protein [Ptychodera flava]|uniref:uncharacterized protein n=1 Tax=Ptychodera flava TaxID=63121 RepID=UPI00396A8524